MQILFSPLHIDFRLNVSFYIANRMNLYLSLLDEIVQVVVVRLVVLSLIVSW